MSGSTGTVNQLNRRSVITGDAVGGHSDGIPVSRRIRVTAGAAGLFLTLIAVWLSAGGDFLLRRSLWMDEVHTWILVSDPDPGHALSALADGVDYNPPGYYLLARMAGWLPGGLSSYRLRLFSLGCVIAALLAVYLLGCRRFSPFVSATAVLCMSGHALLIQQVTEIRFYALWLAAAAWLCWLLDHRQRRESLWQTPLSMGLAALICTCHYFGIFSLVLVLSGSCVFRRDRASLRFHAAVLLTGLVSLLLCWPFLAGQRAALTRPTWITPPTAGDSLNYLLAATPLSAVVMLLAGVSAAAVISGLDRRSVISSLSLAWRTPGVALAAMPAVLVAFAWLIQPALVLRYAVTGAIGFVPLLAALISLQGRKGQTLCFAVGVMCSFHAVQQSVRQWQDQETQRERLATVTRELPEQRAVLFEDRTVWLPLVCAHPQLLDRCYLADFADSQMAVDSNLRAVQRDVGRRIAKWYPQYQLRSLASLRADEDFLIVPYSGGGFRDLHYPTGREILEYQPGIYWFSHTQKPVPAESGRREGEKTMKNAADERQMTEKNFDNRSR